MHANNTQMSQWIDFQIEMQGNFYYVVGNLAYIACVSIESL